MSAVQKTKPQACRPRASENVGTDQGSNDANDTPEIGASLCPRYDRCSAPVCPLDPDWRLRSHLKGEPVCGLLLEFSKTDGEATLRGFLPAQVAQVAITLAPALLARHAPLRKAWEKASKTGSRLALLARRRATESGADHD